MSWPEAIVYVVAILVGGLVAIMWVVGNSKNNGK